MIARNAVSSALVMATSALFFWACAPQVVDFTPKKGTAGTEVTIEGKHFKSNLADNTVKFGEITASDILEAKETRIVVRVPGGAQTGPISVTTSDGTGTSAESFAVGDENRGFALAIGLNGVDPVHYAGWSGELSGCEPDALDMKKIASDQGFSVETLLTAQATRDAVINKLKDLSGKLKSGDLLVVSYSGHGGQIPDQNGDETVDGLDETWCLYDGELLDDELYGAWANFPAGVRILVFSDSCHSGTVLKMIRSDWDNPAKMEKHKEDWERAKLLPALNRVKVRSLLETDKELKLRIRAAGLKRPAEKAQPAETEPEMEVFVSRSLPPMVQMAVFSQNRAFYEGIGKAAPAENSGSVKASVVLISGCEDSQTSADIGFNGLFTLKLKQVWNNGQFSGNHTQFHEAIKAAVLQMNSEQSPNLFTIGPDSEIQAFLGQRPYAVGQ
jgi:hypothetical protein